MSERASGERTNERRKKEENEHNLIKAKLAKICVGSYASKNGMNVK